MFPQGSGRSVHFSFPLACRTHSLAYHPVDAKREEHDDCSAQRGSGSTGQITGTGLRVRFVEPIDDLRSGETGYDERQYDSANRCPFHFIPPFASFSRSDRLTPGPFPLYPSLASCHPFVVLRHNLARSKQRPYSTYSKHGCVVGYIVERSYRES